MLEIASKPATGLKVQRLLPQAQLPKKANPSDACYDLFCAQAQRVWSGQTAVLEVGLAIQLEEGWEAQIRGRSGLARKGIVIHPGTVDHLYRQAVKVLVHNLSGETWDVQCGDRIAQMKIERVWEVELCEGEVEPTHRGGLGSTGR